MNLINRLTLSTVLLAAAPGALLAADEVRQKVAEYQSKGYNVLFIAVDDMNNDLGTGRDVRNCFAGTVDQSDECLGLAVIIWFDPWHDVNGNFSISRVKHVLDEATDL